MIEVKNLCINLGDFTLKNITLNVKRSEYFAILGPTGAGKTVLLEAIAGLYPIESGEIWLDGREVTNLSPEKRGVSIVYQDCALFPHLSVRENILFGPKLRREARQSRESALDSITSLLSISHLLNRKPETLSGGEKQRAALARALIIKPRVLLLDEPISALDPESRENVRHELRQIHEHLRITIVHVTHDFEEAVALGERIAVLNEGRMMQTGTPEEIFRKPNSEFVAHFAMARNIFAGEVRDGSDGYSTFITEDMELAVATELRGKLHASIRPEDILVSAEPLSSSARNSFRGTVTRISDTGSTLYLTISIPPNLVCLVTRRSFEDMNLGEGKEVYVTFKAAAVHVF